MREDRADTGVPGPRLGERVPVVVPAKVRIPAAAALPRERLESRLAEAFARRLTLVVAPAGSGKTTLVARFAATSGVPVAWYRADAWDADERSLLRHLEAALRGAMPELGGGWSTMEHAIEALEARATRNPGPVALVVDDFHTLEATEAEAAFGRFVDWAPDWLAVVVASRVAPGINLSRLRVSGDLLELGTDDLRFRAWEVEQLFRDVYHDPVPPADLAVLARRTEGWAAGLQLFHLATRGRSADERRRVLGGPGSSGRLLREYLAQNVMVGLPVELRDFLLDTCVLGRLSGPVCDRLRETSGSSALLDELNRRGVFTIPAEDGSDAYRYHEVLRQHLDRVIVETLGEAVARDRHAAAGRLLEADGSLPEALRAYCRAEDWEAVQRLLGVEGERLAAGEGDWIDALPPAIERHDPWVALAAARRARHDGRWAAALAAYARAEAELGPARSSEAPRRERLALAAWVDPAALPPSDASGLLRTGLVRDPAVALRDLRGLQDPSAQLARGLLTFAAGEVVTARNLLQAAVDDEDTGPIGTAAARVALAAVGVLSGSPWDPQAFGRAAEEAERVGVPWLARLARGLGRRLDPAGPGVAVARAGEEDPGEPWGDTLLLLASAWRSPLGPQAGLDAAEVAAEGFRGLGSGVLESWSRALAALAAASSGVPEARDAAIGAEGLGRAVGSPGARAAAQVAIAIAVDRPINDDLALATGSGEVGLAIPEWARVAMVRSFEQDVPDGAGWEQVGGDASAFDVGVRSVRIRLLGGCVLVVDGQPVVMNGAKPRVRSLFRLLAVHAGAAVHREVIQEALWPDADAAAGARNLHVALSALRRHLDEVAPTVGASLVARDGDAYRLAVDADAVDLGRFERAVAQGRAARTRGEPASAAFMTAIDLYGGDLLPEEGPVEWVSSRRDHCRAKAVEAAQGLAEEALLAGDHATAIRACRFGLEIDRYQDAFWRMLILARERAGDAGAASRDRREYAQVLEALGVSVPAEVRTA